MHLETIHPRPGDQLSRQKDIFLTHTGRYVGNGLVFHSTPEKGPHLSTLAEFADGHQVTVYPVAEGARSAILARIDYELHQLRQYDLLTNNCQHVASRVGTGRGESFDLQLALLMLGLIATTMIASKH